MPPPPRLLTLLPPATETCRAWCAAAAAAQRMPDSGGGGGSATQETLDKCVDDLEQACKEMVEENTNADELEQVLTLLVQLDQVFVTAEMQSLKLVSMIWKTICKLVQQNKSACLQNPRYVVDACAVRLIVSCNVTDVEMGKKLRSFFITRLVTLLSTLTERVDLTMTLEAACKVEMLSRDQDWTNLVIKGICEQLNHNSNEFYICPTLFTANHCETLKLILVNVNPINLVPKLCASCPAELWSQLYMVLLECLPKNTHVNVDMLVLEWAFMKTQRLNDVTINVLRARGGGTSQQVANTAIQAVAYMYACEWTNTLLPSHRVMTECERLICLAWCVDAQVTINTCLSYLVLPATQDWNLSSCAAAKVLRCCPNHVVLTKNSLANVQLVEWCTRRLSKLLSLYTPSSSSSSSRAWCVEMDARLCILDIAARCELGTMESAIVAAAVLEHGPDMVRRSAIHMLTSCASLLTMADHNASFVIDVFGSIEKQGVEFWSLPNNLFALLHLLKSWGSHAPILRRRDRVAGGDKTYESRMDTAITRFSQWIVTMTCETKLTPLITSMFDAIRILAANSCVNNVSHLVPRSHHDSFRKFLEVRKENEGIWCEESKLERNHVAELTVPPSSSHGHDIPARTAAIQAVRLAINALHAIHAPMNVLNQFNDEIMRELRQ